MSGLHIFISGGCKNGKSYFAQRIAKELAQREDARGDVLPCDKLYYIATMIPHDAEDDARIARHLREREGWGFATLEYPHSIANCFERADADGSFLLDSVTALLANNMFREDGTVDEEAGERTASDICAFLDRAKNAVLVSDYIYSDAAKYDALTEEYRRSLAYVDRTLAKRCDEVIEICAGNAYYHKHGGKLL